MARTDSLSGPARARGASASDSVTVAPARPGRRMLTGRLRVTEPQARLPEAPSDSHGPGSA